MMEPVLNNAQERQAINRCDRLGQTKQTFVRRYVVGSTVEERILQVQRRRAQHAEVMMDEEDEQPKARASWANTQKKNLKQSADAHGLGVDDLQFILSPH
jgi:SNF2 family DNA or RNA helicase